MLDRMIIVTLSSAHKSCYAYVIMLINKLPCYFEKQTTIPSFVHYHLLFQLICNSDWMVSCKITFGE